MSLTVAIVGFEEPSYTVNETDAFVEVCVVITNPSANEELAFPIEVVIETRNIAVGEFIRIYISNSSSPVINFFLYVM